MSLGRLVVAAVRVEGRSKSGVARDYGVSRRWVHELVRRFEAEGEVGLEPRSRRPKRSPYQTPLSLEDEVVELRKHLAEEGLDAGAHTIAFHLGRRHGSSPAPSTISSSRLGGVCSGLRSGRRDRGSQPASPSISNRRTSSCTHRRETP